MPASQRYLQFLQTTHYGSPDGLEKAKFADAFSGMKAPRQLTREELIRAIRQMIASEYEAIQLYVQLAESTDDKLAAKVLRDIADEEKVHAGEFLELLSRIDPEEKEHYQEGAKEVQELASIKKAITRAYLIRRA